MKAEIKRQCYEILLNEPLITQKEIAKRLGVSEPTVSRAINSITKAPEYTLALKTFSTYIQDAQKLEDFLKLKIGRLSQLQPETIEQELAIIRLQTDLAKDAFQFVKGGEVLKAVQHYRDQVAKLSHKD